MRNTDLLHLCDGISDTTVDVDTDPRTHSSLVTFTGRHGQRWTMSIWLDGSTIEGFIVTNQMNGIELTVRNIAAVTGEPVLERLIARVCDAGNFTTPAQK